MQGTGLAGREVQGRPTECTPSQNEQRKSSWVVLCSLQNTASHSGCHPIPMQAGQADIHILGGKIWVALGVPDVLEVTQGD